MKKFLYVSILLFLSACLGIWDKKDTPIISSEQPVINAENKASTKWKQNFAIIPHFMLNAAKVDEFYQLLKSTRYSDWSPETIIVISPNHFNTKSKKPQTICKKSEITFHNNTYTLSPFPETDYSENIFYSFGNLITTQEHGIGEQLQRIHKYFPNANIIPLILPTHLQPDTQTNNFFSSESTLIIASIDFSHYQPESTALTNDQNTIKLLTSQHWTRNEFRSLDVDCPACLYLIDQLAQKANLLPNIRRRDSSSTILWKDMQEENTSRVFIWYQL